MFVWLKYVCHCFDDLDTQVGFDEHVTADSGLDFLTIPPPSRLHTATPICIHVSSLIIPIRVLPRISLTFTHCMPQGLGDTGRSMVSFVKFISQYYTCNHITVYSINLVMVLFFCFLAGVCAVPQRLPKMDGCSFWTGVALLILTTKCLGTDVVSVNAIIYACRYVLHIGISVFIVSYCK